MKYIIYLTPDFFEDDMTFFEFERLTNEEKIHVASNSNEAIIYTLEGFQEAFNAEEISDQGFIYIV